MESNSVGGVVAIGEGQNCRGKEVRVRSEAHSIWIIHFMFIGEVCCVCCARRMKENSVI